MINLTDIVLQMERVPSPEEKQNCSHPLIYLLSNSCFNYLELYCPCCGKRDIVPRQAVDDEFCSLAKVIDLRRKREESDYQADIVIDEANAFLKDYQIDHPEAQYSEIKAKVKRRNKILVREKKEG